MYLSAPVVVAEECKLNAMNSMKKQILIAVSTLALSITGVMIFTKASQPHIAYVINGQLYDDFDMKKQFEARSTNVVQMRKGMMDSLTLRLNMDIQSWRANGGKDTAQERILKMRQQELYVKQQQFEQDNQQMGDQYDQQIWKQLNQYVQDYGKAHGYSFIFGATGDGGIMYAGEALNITNEMKVYVNERYKNGK